MFVVVPTRAIYMLKTMEKSTKICAFAVLICAKVAFWATRPNYENINVSEVVK